MKGKRLDEIIERAIFNVEEDRSTANKLLTDLVLFMHQTGDSAHATSGETAAKYLETLQRSNEQLVKIAAILQRQAGGSRGLSEDEKKSLFDSIKE